MAFPHRDLGQDMPSLEAENLRGSYLQTLKERRAQLFGGPFLWERILKRLPISDFEDVSKIQASTSGMQEMEIAKPFLCSLSKLCEETESKDFYLLSDGFSRVSLEEALICLHKEQSDFKGLSDRAIALCLHVASVVFLNSVLLGMRVYASEHNTKYNLSKELGDIYQKWKWGGGCWNRMVNTKWLKFVQVAADEEKEEAMKLLYQWTRYPLLFVVPRVKKVIDGITQLGGDAAYVARVSRWGDELCSFLEHCRALFKPSNHTEFLYFELPDMYKRTALLHMSIGDNKVAAQLLEAQLRMVEGIGDSEGKLRWVATCDLTTSKTTYDHERDPATLLLQKEEICVRLEKLGVPIDCHLQEVDKEWKDLEERGTFAEHGQSEGETHCKFVFWCEPHYNTQIMDIIDLICRDRYTSPELRLFLTRGHGQVCFSCLDCFLNLVVDNTL